MKVKTMIDRHCSHQVPFHSPISSSESVHPHHQVLLLLLLLLHRPLLLLQPMMIQKLQTQNQHDLRACSWAWLVEEAQEEVVQAYQAKGEVWQQRSSLPVMGKDLNHLVSAQNPEISLRVTVISVS